MKKIKNFNDDVDDLFSTLHLPTDDEIRLETNNKKVSLGLKTYFGTAKQRFNSSIKIQSDGCWIYPKRWIIDDDGNQFLPKNYSAIIYNIKFPSGCIKNTCGNKKCVNPKHLKDYPKVQQALDSVSKRKTLLGDNHPGSKLNTKDIKSIKKIFSKLLKERNGKSKGIASIIHREYPYVTLTTIINAIKK